MLIFFKIVEGEIYEEDYGMITFLSCLGPVMSIILIMFGIGYLLVKVPYWILFGRDNK